MRSMISADILTPVKSAAARLDNADVASWPEAVVPECLLSRHFGDEEDVSLALDR